MNRNGPAFLSALVFAAVNLTGCLSLPFMERPDEPAPEAAAPHSDISLADLPVNTFRIVTRPMSTEEKAADNALDQAAALIAMNSELVIFSGRVEESSGRDLISSSDSSYNYDTEAADTIKERLKITGIRKMGDNQLVVLVQDPSGSASRRSDQFGFSCTFSGANAKKPDWVTRPPKVDGYFTGVGMVLQHRFLADGVLAADMAAAEQIALQFSAVVQDYSSVQGQDAGTRTSSYQHSANVVVAREKIAGFFVLDRWIDPSNGYIYSLAVGKKR